MTMSWKQKLASAVATAAMVASILPAGAMGLTADTEISVTGIDAGDTAAYYQVVRQNADTKKWELTEAFSNVSYGDPAHTITIDDILNDGINADEAGALAAAAAGATAGGNLDGTTYKASVAPGTYLVLVTPANGNTDVVYKPIFVSADYDQTSPNTVNASEASLPVPTTATAKKSPLDLTKTATSDDLEPRGVAVGDTIKFEVTSCVPTFSSNFIDPKYWIQDELSEGLELDEESIKVTVDKYEVASPKDYEIVDVTDSGYTVKFKDSFLYGVTGNPTVTITYKATVTSDAPTQVNEMDNTVTLTFSNTPTDGEGHLEDKTRHYTFDIDGSVFGSDAKKTDEVVKVGLDANGKPVYETTSYEAIPSTESPLAGAKFELRTKASDPSTALKFTDGVLDTKNGSTVLTSDAGGYIPMKGLDAGKYYLVETSAPAGYSFDPSPRMIDITAKYAKDSDGYDVLESYTITFTYTPEGETEPIVNTSTYTVGQDSEKNPIPLHNQGATITEDTEGNNTSLIVNTKLGLLPSTGGSGIYFYLIVGGAIAGASAYLIRRTRRQEELLAQ